MNLLFTVAIDLIWFILHSMLNRNRIYFSCFANLFSYIEIWYKIENDMYNFSINDYKINVHLVAWHAVLFCFQSVLLWCSIWQIGICLWCSITISAGCWNLISIILIKSLLISIFIKLNIDTSTCEIIYLLPWLAVVLHWSTTMQNDTNLTCLTKPVRFR